MNPGYFNTNGGNTVSSAVDLAVLEVIEQENLIASVGTAGKAILDGITALSPALPGDWQRARGGLFVSVDFVKTARSSVTRAGGRQCVREEGVLIGAKPTHPAF